MSESNRWHWIASVVLLASAFPLEIRSATPPPLNVNAINPTTVQLSWPNAAPGFILQESDTPSLDGIWRGVPDGPVLAGGTLAVTKSLTPGFIRHFYRLRTKGVFPGLDYLVATQNPDGTWGNGSSTDFLTTTAAIEALSTFGVGAGSVNSGLSGVFGLPVRNNDDLSRKIVALARAGMNIDSLVADLANAQGAEVTTGTALGFPGNGWGLAKGFGNSTIDTALGLRAVLYAGLSAGLAVVKEPVPAGGASPVHTFQVPSGASGMLLRIRSVTGATLHFSLTPPGSSPRSVDVPPRTTTLNIINLPNTPGTWTMQVSNAGAVAGSYTAQIGFTDSTGFDSFRVSNGFVYLGLAQNADGGWGISSGEDSQLMITSEVLQTLAAAGTVFAGPQALTGGSTWLLSHRNADGGFSNEANNSNDTETSLAMIALRLASPATSLSTSIAYLKGRQLPDGSWSSNPYATARAAQALFLPPAVSPIPGQTVADPALFAAISLDNYVTDPDNADNELTWVATGQSALSVSIVNRVATITYPPGTRTTETITFTATDPDGLSGSASANFTVTSVDFAIPRGGSVTSSRNITASSTTMSQVATFIETPSGVPPGVTYTRTGAAFTSATQINISFRIDVAAGATPGFYTFQVKYDFYDAANNLIPGPFTGNVFNISIQITP